MENLNLYETLKVLHIGVGPMEQAGGGAGNPWRSGYVYAPKAIENIAHLRIGRKSTF